MEVRRAYCSAVDHLVPVVLRPSADPTPDDRDRRHGRETVDPSDLYCLDYKVRCSGWCCPLFSTSDELIQLEPQPAGTAHPPEAAADDGRPRRWTRPT